MIEEKYEVVLVDSSFVVIARHTRTFSLEPEAQNSAWVLNMDLATSPMARWIVRQNSSWLELYRE